MSHFLFTVRLWAEKVWEVNADVQCVYDDRRGTVRMERKREKNGKDDAGGRTKESEGMAMKICRKTEEIKIKEEKNNES